MNIFDNIIIGQEAICPDGLGRVMSFKNSSINSYVQISTYINNRGCKWNPVNIELIELKKIKNEITEVDIICCNDNIEAVVLNDSARAEKELERLKVEGFKKIKINGRFKNMDEYTQVFYWHIHPIDSI